MEIKKNDKATYIPAWVLVAGIMTVGGIVTEICKTIIQTK